MASKQYILFSFILLILLPSCNSVSTEDKNNQTAYALLENGDLIYRHGNGIFSDYFRKTSKTEQNYSHGGIIFIENDSIYVLHSEASEFTGIGGVKKESIDTFLKNISTWGVYRIDTTEAVRNKIVSIAKEYINTPFDLDFNSEDDSKIYCTELIAISVNKAMDSTIIVPRNTFRQNMYYAIDDTYLMPKTHEVVKITN